MKLIPAISAGLAATLVLAGASAATPSTEDIIAHHVAARGGAQRLAALSVLDRSGKLIVPGFNLLLTVRDIKTRAGQYRQEVTLQGLTQVQAFDGTAAWQVQPFQGRKDPSLMSADEAKGLAQSADIDWPFVDAKRKGHTVENLGVEDIDGTAAYKLRVKLKSGNESTFWIDPDSWMVIRELDRQTVRGAEQVTETDFGEYEQVEGVYVPMSEQQGPKDSDASQKQKIVYDRATGNGTLPPTEFSFPATPATPAAGAKGQP
jgi:hypothetical protein